MNAEPIKHWITPLSIEEPDHSLVELFHQQTKFYPSTNALIDRRVATHLTDQRAILEASANRKRYCGRQTVALPTPRPIETALSTAANRRRSCRSFAGTRMSDQLLSDLLATLRVTAEARSAYFPEIILSLRSYASGGGLYPCEIYVARRKGDAGAVNLYQYGAHEHGLTPVGDRIDPEALRHALADHDGISDGASLVVFITAIFRRSMTKYGAAGYRFSLIEAGEIGHQLALAAAGLDLASLMWGGAYDDKVNALLELDGIDETLLLTLMVGEPGHD